ncbi:hypothetical protein C8F01DRAFT_687692 [Mycena amicta]|nr:hypothetical protein C8F01DRAFT_687692 [Mycena amicta]
MTQLDKPVVHLALEVGMAHIKLVLGEATGSIPSWRSKLLQPGFEGVWFGRRNTLSAEPRLDTLQRMSIEVTLKSGATHKFCLLHYLLFLFPLFVVYGREIQPLQFLRVVRQVVFDSFQYAENTTSQMLFPEPSRGFFFDLSLSRYSGTQLCNNASRLP